MTMTNLNAIKSLALGDITSAQLAAAIAELNAMTIAEYALGFGGLMVSDELLTTYKAEYVAKLTNHIAAKQ